MNETIFGGPSNFKIAFTRSYLMISTFDRHLTSNFPPLTGHVTWDAFVVIATGRIETVITHSQRIMEHLWRWPCDLELWIVTRSRNALAAKRKAAGLQISQEFSLQAMQYVKVVTGRKVTYTGSRNMSFCRRRRIADQYSLLQLHLHIFWLRMASQNS